MLIEPINIGGKLVGYSCKQGFLIVSGITREEAIACAIECYDGIKFNEIDK